MEYTVKDFTVSLPVDEYISRFRDEECFIKRCKECDNYGCSWAGPPFDFEIEARLRQYDRVLLIATKLVLARPDIPLKEVFRFIRPERVRLDRTVLGLEKKVGGYYLGFSGTCLYCPEGTCTRKNGEPCRHPELVRPSLEAYGFDLGRTVKELFDSEIKWSSNGYLPEYITLVSGFFHNSNMVTSLEAMMVESR